MVQSVVINIKNTDVLKTGIVFSQGDKGTEAELQIFVKDDEAYVLNAEKAEISFKRADGHVVIGELTGSDGVYSYHFSGNELQSAGEAVATVTLTFSDGRISSGAFSFQVRYNPMFDKSIEAGPYIWQLEKIVENAKTYTEYLKNLIAQLKPEVGSTALTKADLLNDFSQTAAGLKAMDAAAGKRIWDNFGKYIPSGKIVNNLLATQAGNVLDATQGKVLGDKVAKVEQSITELNSELEIKHVNVPIDETYVTREQATQVTYYKFGKIILLYFYDIHLKPGFPTENVATIASGLPVPSPGMIPTAVAHAHDTVIRVSVAHDGKLKPWYVGNTTDTVFSGQIIYTIQ